MDPQAADPIRPRTRRRRIVASAVAAIVLGSALSASPALADDLSSHNVSPFVTSGQTAPFNREAAVKWARDHAKDDEPLFYPGCTWFVTQSLWAGGVPKNPDWTNEGSRGQFIKTPGTASATAVQPFLEQLFASYPGSRMTRLSMSQNAVPEAQEGDLIVYSWDGKSWDHLSMVTHIGKGNYPDVSEWGVYGVGTPKDKRYVQRGWTWSENSHDWLQHKYPQMQAALIHVDTTIPTRY